MKVDLINLNSVPDKKELISIIGYRLYSYFVTISDEIHYKLLPDLERWSEGGRRGKYYNGFIITRNHTTIDLYFISENGRKQITCNIHISKRLFNKILKQNDTLSHLGKEAIESSIKLNEIYSSGYYLNFLIKEDNLDIINDVLKVINILSL